MQGVGFRPFVHQLATQHRSDRLCLQQRARCVRRGSGSSIDSFVAALLEHPPPLSRIDRLDNVFALPDELETTFSILKVFPSDRSDPSSESTLRPVKPV